MSCLSVGGRRASSSAAIMAKRKAMLRSTDNSGTDTDERAPSVRRSLRLQGQKAGLDGGVLHEKESPLRKTKRKRNTAGSMSEQNSTQAASDDTQTTVEASKKPISKGKKNILGSKGKSSIENTEKCEFLPRDREAELLASNSTLQFVMGIDEAGRGPLAGPVVAAAAIVSTNLSGVIDSKKVTNEETRWQLHQALLQSKGVRWAVAIVSADRIDEINILQATLQGMSMAATAILGLPLHHGFRMEKEASAQHEGCYVVTNVARKKASDLQSVTADAYYALVDGNRLPKDLPCAAEPLVKGDGREYSIAAASIFAKVTRDNLLHQYDQMYPLYNLRQHKGYPTAAHMAAVRKHGASAIHRRSFAPLKHMNFDKDGRVVGGD